MLVETQVNFLGPVLKKGKYSNMLENYRGITVTATFGKLFEYALLDKLKFAQSELQFGFTEGLSPAMAGLLVCEAKADSQDNKTHSYVATLDSQKAFDVVHHTILLDKLIQTNIHDASWLVIDPHLPIGPVHPYQMDESISNFRGVWCTFFIFIIFLIEIPISKQ